MKKIIAALTLLLPLLSAAQRSTLETGTLHSEILKADKPYSVYLPAGYADSGETYPVLYLLHGASDSHTAWVEKGNMRTIADRVIAEGMSLGMIIVMPDASGEGADNRGKNMGYFNMEGWAYEGHFFQEFIPHIEKTYRIKADKQHRAIAGLSMGGGGSMVYGVHHPEMFSSVCPLSGLIGEFDNSNSVQTMNQFRKSAYENNPQDYIRKATPQQLDALRTVRWYIDCGDDDYLAGGNVTMFLLMREKKIPLQYRMRDGAHNWLYWQQALSTVMQFCSIGFASGK
ncbi:MAG: endo-1,4-beta-xylanase Z [Rikenellaceae bacterium]|jgi:enterochelin esterase-like enzyme|nr:endo-1,4-beta-xylanase Z [Rikenellaceae bacterium]